MNNEIVVFSRYEEASIRFRDVWLEYVGKEDEVKFEIVNMVKILEKDGFTRTEVIKRIIDDHKDLKGFSRASIYRELPQDMKKPNPRKDLQELGRDADVPYKDSDVSNETSENLNTTSAARNSESQTLKDFRESKGTTMNEAVDTVYDIEDDDQSQEPQVIYDNPQTILKQYEERIKETDKKYEDLEDKYSELITPYEVRVIEMIKGQELPFIIKVDPYKRTATLELDQEEVKKLKRF